MPVESLPPPPSALLANLASGLAELDAAGLRRTRRCLESPCAPRAIVDGKEVLAFASNDYLGLANHPALVAAAQAAAGRWGVGSGASHLVSGHLAPHAEAEAALAAFTGFGAALTFSSGYLANLAIVSSLVGRGDAVFHDRLNHASLIDAVQLARADSRRYAHADHAALAERLAASSARRKLILSDAVFSMDGDIAPLGELLALAERYDAWLVIDDAHGFGVLGAGGRGTLSALGVNPATARLIMMGTLGKAAGLAGAFVAAAPAVIDWLVNRARSYVFTTAASPVIAACIAPAIELIRAAEAPRAHLRELIAALQSGLADLPWRLLRSDTAIQPLIVGDNHAASRLAAALYQRGIWVPAIRPPTVPQGSARLRISLSAAHSHADVASLIAALRALA